MLHKLTITVEDDVYEGLHRVVGRGQIGRFLANLARPHVTGAGSLKAAEGLGCTGYRGPARTDAQIKRAVKAGVRARWAKSQKKAG